MRILEVARELEISADWLRRLERDGRIPKVQRDLNGHRRYSPESVEEIRRVVFNGRVSGRVSSPMGEEEVVKAP